MKRKLVGKLLGGVKRLPGIRRIWDLVPYAYGLAAAVIGAFGALVIVFGESAWVLIPGLSAHVAAAFLSVHAARLRRDGELSPVERDLVLYTALFVPLMGAGAAFVMPRRDPREDVENAHEVVERYMDHVKPQIPDYERTLFVGDFDRDLARKLDTESYREVLNHGDTDQKRSALFKLAEMRGPHHLALIRSCLTDDDGEVRLYAYGELDRLTREYEGAVAKARKEAEAEPGSSERQQALSRSHFELATSGVMDGATGRFHLKVAAEHAVKARRLDPSSPEPVLLEARAYAHVGDIEKARACLQKVPADNWNETAVCMVRAEVAFHARDYPEARLLAGRLLVLGEELPGWLGALCVVGSPLVVPPAADGPEADAAAGDAESGPPPAAGDPEAEEERREDASAPVSPDDADITWHDVRPGIEAADETWPDPEVELHSPAEESAGGTEPAADREELEENSEEPEEDELVARGVDETWRGQSLPKDFDGTWRDEEVKP